MSKIINLLAMLVLVLVSFGCNDVSFRSQGSDPDVTTKNTYAWYEGGYVNACSKACGGGTQTQVVQCRRQDNVVVADSFCTGTKPNSVRTCNIDPCTTTYSWNIGPWSTMCSKTCGGGEITRTVVCQDNNGGATVADTYCSAVPKPSTTQPCNTQACTDPFTYSWYIIPGICSKQCGGGVQTDDVLCRRSDNAIVAETFCNMATKPPTTHACNTQACPAVYTYAWTSGAWSTCSKTCGGGLQTRSIQCRRNDGEYVAETYCDVATKPAAQQACNTMSCPTTKEVTTTASVSPALNQVDVIMIVDDSSSMAADQAKLAQRMSGFLSDLDALNIDYQVCITTTDTSYYQGSPIKWSGLSGYVITKSTPNKTTVFTNTLNAIGAEWSSDERGIYALNLMVKDYWNTGCFRPQATLTSILISDEDERSVGGNPALSSQQYKPLEAGDMPSNLISAVDAKWSTSTFKKPFIWNSIIVKPGDSVCRNSQNATGTPSFYGTMYKELSSLTYGHVGSICDTDYSENLKYIKTQVVNSMPGLTLECTPIGTPVITYTPPTVTSVTLVGNQVKFSPALPEGVSVTVKYNCPL